MKKVLLIVVIALIVVCGVGSFAFRNLNAAREAAKKSAKNSATVTRGDLVVKVVETGTIDAVKSVEVKSRVSGRVAKLLVDEGDRVAAGQLIAVIDPQETELRVRQDRAQLRGAISGVQRQELEIEQRRVTAAADLRSAEARVAQLRAEIKAQPILTRSSIEQAETALNTALHERDRLNQSSHPTQRVSAQATQREAQANYDNAVREADRQRDLVAKGFTSQRSVDSAVLQVDLARARLDSANENLRRLEAQFAADRVKVEDSIRQARSELARARANSIAGTLKDRELDSALASLAKARVALRDVDVMRQSQLQSQASVDQLRAGLDDAVRQLNETNIRAPLSGIVTKRLVQEGELVASLSSFSSGTPIVRIEDQHAMRVKLEVNEIDVAKLKLGLPATIEVDAIPNEKFSGKVQKVSPAATTQQQGGQSEAVVKYQVEIYLAKADERLKTGMSARCTLESLRRDKVLQLPLEYVGKDGDRRFVQFPLAKDAKKDAKPVQKDVKVGAQTGSSIEILSGVTEGQKVVKPDFKGPKRKGFMQFGPDDGEQQ